ncbi:MAG: hypothetical protein KDA60_15355 [Planctomycetales bacterium]|nr:hypothetical protein [Planctomycetales bacterium]
MHTTYHEWDHLVSRTPALGSLEHLVRHSRPPAEPTAFWATWGHVETLVTTLALSREDHDRALAHLYVRLDDAADHAEVAR